VEIRRKGEVNLLLINYEYPPIGGGAANATLCLGRAFSSLGHQVDVLTSGLSGAEGRFEENAVTVHRLPVGRKQADRGSVFQMARFLAQSRVCASRLQRTKLFGGAIAFFTIPSGPAALALNRFAGVPYVVSLRGGDVPGHVPGLRLMHTFTRPLRRAVLRGATAIAANSDSLAATSIAADPFPVHVIANGVDCDRFRPADPRSTGEPFRVLFVGRVHPEKNLGAVIEQLPSLPGLELLVAGDGAQRAELAARAAELGVADRIRWLGWQEKDALPALYRAADVLVNPSLYEGSPNVVLEAMASGLPTVASDTPGNRSVVRDGENGLLFPLAEPTELRAALARLAADRSLAHRLGENGRARAVAEFSWIRCAESYLELLGAARRSSRFS
jgi:glycosyltransferase involved in cell wall biosynthesis